MYTQRERERDPDRTTKREREREGEREHTNQRVDETRNEVKATSFGVASGHSNAEEDGQAKAIVPPIIIPIKDC